MKFYQISLFLFIIPLVVNAKVQDFDTLANDNKCLTFHNSNQKNKILKTLYYDSTGRPINQKIFLSPSGLFLIHYDTSGVHSVDLTDNAHNGIPDYVDSVAYYCDYTYQKEVVEFGFRSPLGDSSMGGSDAYDIYLLNIGDRDLYPNSNGVKDNGGAYGFTQAELQINSGTGYAKNTSFIIIDNDFSPKDSMLTADNQLVQSFKVFGYDGAKVTIAHEFHHAIQMRYGFDDYTGAIIAEMSSVMMEMTLYPEILDYMQYVRSLFKNPSKYPFSKPDANVGYRYGIFAYFLQKRYGMDAIKKIWEVIGNGTPTYRAINLALQSYNSSLNQGWKEFIKTIYYTNSRGKSNPYFENAWQMPEFSIHNEMIFSPPSASYSGELLQYEIRMDRTIINNQLPLSNDTLIAISSSFDTTALFNQNTYYDDFNASICNDNVQDAILIFDNSSRKKYFFLSSIHNTIEAELIEIIGEETNAIDYAFPSPFRYNDDDIIYFPAPENIEIGKKANIKIYNSAMKEIYNNDISISSINKNRIIALDIKNTVPRLNLETGVYIYEIHANGEQKIGKIAIIK